MDVTIRVMFGSVLLLILSNAVAALLLVTLGAAFTGLVVAALRLTIAFAVIGAALLLVRGLRRGTIDRVGDASGDTSIP